MVRISVFLFCNLFSFSTNLERSSDSPQYKTAEKQTASSSVNQHAGSLHTLLKHPHTHAISRRDCSWQYTVTSAQPSPFLLQSRNPFLEDMLLLLPVLMGAYDFQVLITPQLPPAQPLVQFG